MGTIGKYGFCNYCDRPRDIEVKRIRRDRFGNEVSVCEECGGEFKIYDRQHKEGGS